VKKKKRGVGTRNITSFCGFTKRSPTKGVPPVKGEVCSPTLQPWPQRVIFFRRLDLAKGAGEKAGRQDNAVPKEPLIKKGQRQTTRRAQVTGLAVPFAGLGYKTRLSRGKTN